MLSLARGTLEGILIAIKKRNDKLPESFELQHGVVSVGIIIIFFFFVYLLERTASDNVGKNRFVERRCVCRILGVLDLESRTWKQRIKILFRPGRRRCLPATPRRRGDVPASLRRLPWLYDLTTTDGISHLFFALDRGGVTIILHAHAREKERIAKGYHIGRGASSPCASSRYGIATFFIDIPCRCVGAPEE